MENHLSPRRWFFMNCKRTAIPPNHSNNFLFPIGLALVASFAVLALIGLHAIVAHLAAGGAVLAMGAAAPRERLLGTIDYKRNGFNELIQGKGGGLASEIYDYFRLVLRGNEDKKSTLNFTVNAGNPFSLIKSIQTRHGSDAWNDVSGTDLRQLSHKIHDEYRRAHEAPATTATSNDATTGALVTEAFGSSLYLPFRFDDMSAVSRRSGAWPVNRYGQSGSSTAGLRVYWGDELDLTSELGVVATHDVSACAIDVYGRVWTGAPGWDNAKFQLYSRTTENYDVNNVAWKDKKLEIKNKPAQARGFLLFAYVDSPETPQTGLIPDSAAITLLYNNSDRKYEFTAGYIKAMNEQNYGHALDDGYYYLDLAEDGDFGRLQDLSSGTYEIVIGATNQIANAKLRLVTECLMPSL